MDWGLHDAAGAERFEIRRRLGAGGMGVVYEAFDRERDRLVAVKTLRRLEPRAIYRFKREFRALADISHPNLVTLYELLALGKDWLFTMELIDGQTLLEHVWSGRPIHQITTQPSARAAAAPRPNASAGRAADSDKLRSALQQLAAGIAHLHAAGRLHRDIKPSNVLVSHASDRVVLCDFGLIAEMPTGAPYVSESMHMAGTFAYMSPEQAAGQPLTEASDWYSVGVVMYEALCGDVPFADRRAAMMRLKQTERPPPVRELAADCADDLAELCDALLTIEPGDRPPGSDILRRLGVAPSASAPPSTSLSSQFVGREQQLARMRDAFDALADAKPAAVYVAGPSGLGKTALVRRFLAEIEDLDDTLVFSGRCYEREALPYKAFDSLLDAISTYLARLPADDAASLLPDDATQLARLFPVLHRVDAIVRPAFRGGGIQDPHELRRRAFGALRALLRKLCARHRVVLFIDDLQWGDVDSEALIADLLRPPSPPPVLLLGTYRAEDRDTSPLLSRLFQRRADEGDPVASTHLHVGALSPDEAAELARALLGASVPEAEVRSLAAECSGNPLLLQELVRHVRTSHPDPGGDDSSGVTVDGMLRARIARLPPEASQLLHVVAVAGRPTALPVVEHAARIDAELAPTLALLRAESLVRTGRGSRGDIVEPSHDRVRETVISQLDTVELRHCHRRIARALESTGSPDLEMLVAHWLAADDRARAAANASRAADQAADALAFERAARLYQLALEFPESPGHERALQLHLAEALSSAGRGAEAAQAYLAAAHHVPAAEALELQRLAALEFLRGGHVDDGIALLRDVLSQVGLELARTPRRALLSMLAMRAYLRLRGVGFRRRDATQVTPERLAQIDVCWTAAVGLGMIDNIRGAEFQTRHLLMALRAGEPYRIARALSLEVAFLSSTSRRARGRAETISETAEALVRELDRPEQDAWLGGTSALKLYMGGKFSDARDRLIDTVRIIRERCTGMAWELVSCELYLLWSLFYLGDARELIRRVHRLRGEAERRGDLYAAHALRTGYPGMATLLEDRPDDVERQVREAMDSWSKQGFHIEHYWEMQMRMMRDLYVGDGESAYQRVVDVWPRMSGALLLRLQIVRIEMLVFRALCAVAAARGGRREERLRTAERDAARVERERMPWCAGHVHSIRAAVARGRGDAAGGVRLYEAAAAAFDVADMKLHASICQLRAAECAGDDDGRDASLAELSAAGCAAPARVAAMLSPTAPS